MTVSLASGVAGACLVLAFVAALTGILCAVFGRHERHSLSDRIFIVAGFVGLGCFAIVLLVLRLVAGRYLLP